MSLALSLSASSNEVSRRQFSPRVRNSNVSSSSLRDGLSSPRTDMNAVQRAKVQKKDARAKKKNALILCRDRKRFWTTQKQFWQWLREGVIVKTGDSPLTGAFVRRDEENLILVGHTVLNRACRVHLDEVLASRRMRIIKVRGCALS